MLDKLFTLKYIKGSIIIKCHLVLNNVKMTKPASKANKLADKYNG